MARVMHILHRREDQREDHKCQRENHMLAEVKGKQTTAKVKLKSTEALKEAGSSESAFCRICADAGGRATPHLTSAQAALAGLLESVADTRHCSLGFTTRKNAAGSYNPTYESFSVLWVSTLLRVLFSSTI